MDRKKFIQTCGSACVGGTSLSILMQSCKTTFYAPSKLVVNKIVVEKNIFNTHNPAVVKDDSLLAPLYVTKVNEDTYSAVLMYCTHKGCELTVAGKNLVCPCHGSEFLGSGKVLSAPADKDLQSYLVTSDCDTIYIHV